MPKKKYNTVPFDKALEMRIGERLRNMRLKSRDKASDVAQLMGISKGYLSDLENGKRRWSSGLMDAYIAALSPNTATKPSKLKTQNV